MEMLDVTVYSHLPYPVCSLKKFIMKLKGMGTEIFGG